MRKLINRVLAAQKVKDALSSSDQAIAVVRSEAAAVIKSMFIRYFIVMNLVFGIIGFVCGVLAALAVM